ncbi:MAG: phosphatase PAP2 family protein [Eubacterium sp.]|nr:phosphatase PAP2 family protein [Eubacterium sp.]
MFKLLKDIFFELKRRCVFRWWALPVYALGYYIAFILLEHHVTAGSGYHLISAPVDYKIPFCEYFIIPYNAWFVYIMGTVAFFVLVNRPPKEYYRFEINMIIGMTIFLLISWLYPNGLDLRPETFAHQNIFTRMVENLYNRDTPTNVFPSMHVYNSVCAYMALRSCDWMKDKRWLVSLLLLLTVFIIASTLFLKQHSILDVFAALVINYVSYQIVYRSRWAARWQD